MIYSNTSAQNYFSEITLIDFKIKDNLLFVSADVEPIFRVIDLESKEVIASFGLKGRGPGEIENSPYFKLIENTRENYYTIYFIEDATLTLKQFMFNKSNLSVISLENINLPNTLRGLRTVHYVNDSLLVGQNNDYFYQRTHKKRSIFKYNLNTKDFEEQLFYSIKSEPYDLMTELNVNYRDFIYNSKTNTVYTLTSHSNILESYNFNNHLYTFKSLDSDEIKLIVMDTKVFDEDDYLGMYSSFNIIGDYYYTISDVLKNNQIVNIITLYDKNFIKVTSKVYTSNIEFNLSEPFPLNNSIILYGYEGDGFYEVPILNGKLGELKPFLRD